MTSYPANNYCTFKSSRDFALHTCKADFSVLFERGLCWHRSWWARQSSHLKPIWISGCKQESGALCRHRCLPAWRSGIFYSNAFCVRRVGFVVCFSFKHHTYAKRRKWNLEMYPQHCLPLSWFILRMRNVYQAKTKRPSVRRGDGKCRRVCFFLTRSWLCWNWGLRWKSQHILNGLSAVRESYRAEGGQTAPIKPHWV